MNIIAFEDSPTTTFGGSERSYFDVLTGLKKKGHDVTLYYGREGNLVALYEQSGVKTVIMDAPVMLRAGRKIADLRAMLRFAHTVRVARSVLYLNFAEALPLAAVLKVMRGYPIVCHIRLGYWGLSRQIRWAGRLARAFIVINRKFKPVFEKVFGGVRVHVVYNGLGIPTSLPPLSRKPKGDSLRVLYLGRIAPEKGIIELVGAFDNVLRRGVNATLQITGDYVASHSGDYRKELAEAIEKTTAGAHITISPPIENPVEYISGYDLFIFPATWEEPFGRTVPEAILAGTPVLARDVGMIAEIMADNLHFVFSGNDELVEKILQFASGNLKFDAEQARRRVSEEFNKDRMIAEVERELENALIPDPGMPAT